MGTPFSELIDTFLHKVEKDKKYFKYYELSDEEALSLARQRAGYFLEEALGKLVLKACPKVDFSDVDIENQCFNFDLTLREKALIPCLMYQVYLEREIAYLKTLSVNFVDKNLKTYDPSNARNSFKSLLEGVKSENDELIDIYRNSDRSTGAYYEIEFGKYDTEG